MQPHSVLSLLTRRPLRLTYCVLLLALLCPAGAAASVATQLISQALSAHGDTVFFPTHAALTPVTLPDDWSISRPQYQGVVWYRVRFDALSKLGNDETLALYVERVCSNFVVHLNGSRIFSGGRMVEPVARNCYQPHLIHLPAALLHTQGNQLDLKVRGYALENVSSPLRAAGLSQLRIGPLSDLAGHWRIDHFWNVTAAKIAAVMLVVLGVLMIGARWFHRRARYLLYLGLLALGTAVPTVRLWFPELPVSNATVEFAICSMFAPLVGLGIVSLLRYVQLRFRWVDALLLAQCLLLPTTLWMAGPQRLFSAASVWYWILAIEVIVAVLVCLRVSWQRHRAVFWRMLVILLFLALLLALETALRWLVMVEHTYAPHFAIPAVIIVICLRQMQIFARALQLAEMGRSTLESRIQEATAEIERNFAQLSELRVEQVTEKERKRIAADLHDDLGAKLLTIVHTSESEGISTLAREALEEMRLSVRGLTAKPLNVADALGDWRAETVSRLGQAGIEVEWGAATEDVNQLMSARGYVQTTRILREAVSNIIKHSGASQCVVRCTLGQHELVLLVQDNGRGIPLELDGRLDRGHGMSSMKHRAKQMLGQCLVESGPGYGTVIRLTMPL